MSRVRSRSFPSALLAALVLLLFGLSVAWAEEKKEEAGKDRDKARSAGWQRHHPGPPAGPATAPAPPAVPPGGVQNPTQTPPAWRPQPPAPNQQHAPGNGRQGWQDRSGQTNPYARGRLQPGGPPNEAPRAAEPGQRWTPPESPNGGERTPPAEGTRGRGGVGWYPRREQRPSNEGGRVTPGQPREEPKDTAPQPGREPGRWQPRPQPQGNEAPAQGRWRPRPPDQNTAPAPPNRDRGRISGGRDREQPKPQERTRPGEQGKAPDFRTPGQLRTRVPEAKFRGPQAERRVTRVPERPEQLQTRLRESVRRWNTTKPVFQGGHLVRDVVGHQVPRDARFIDRSRQPRTRTGYTRIQTRLGRPTNYYTFIPRFPGDYWDGYWDGYRDGRWDGRRHRPHAAVVINLYYGYYYSDPVWFGFYYPGYYASVYHYYGYCPGWVYPTRVYVAPSDYVYWPADPYRYYGRSQVDEAGAQRALGDLRRAWLNNDVDLLARHLTDDLDIQIYFDGQYEYTTSTEDYYGMTADALASTETESLTFDDPIFISSHEVFYTGRHVFYDPDGYRQTVYVSYRLRKLGDGWYLTAVGSSLEPIRHHYQDFRDN